MGLLETINPNAFINQYGIGKKEVQMNTPISILIKGKKVNGTARTAPNSKGFVRVSIEGSKTVAVSFDDITDIR